MPAQRRYDGPLNYPAGAVSSTPAKAADREVERRIKEQAARTPKDGGR